MSLGLGLGLGLSLGPGLGLALALGLGLGLGSGPGLGLGPGLANQDRGRIVAASWPHRGQPAARTSYKRNVLSPGHSWWGAARRA